MLYAICQKDHRKYSGSKGAHKMLVKLTCGQYHFWAAFEPVDLLCFFWHTTYSVKELFIGKVRSSFVAQTVGRKNNDQTQNNDCWRNYNLRPNFGWIDPTMPTKGAVVDMSTNCV